MAVPNRRALTTRSLRPHAFPGISPQKVMRVASGSTKRPRSPDQLGEHQATPKRVKAVPSPSCQLNRDEDRKGREQRRAEREAQKTEFRVKYTRAFPTWVFYFDLDIIVPENAATRRSLETKVSSLGAVRLIASPLMLIFNSFIASAARRRLL
jgi:regulatory subunit for Cdc7p protein kinase